MESLLFKDIQYSLIIPVYNEEKSLPFLIDEIFSVMKTLDKPFEIVFVDDCSDDTSGVLLKDFTNQYSCVRLITLPNRCGQTFALRKGLEAALGKSVITLDADLQNDPADIPHLISKFNEGYDCVCGWRKNRQDTFLKSVLSKLGNVLQRLLTGLKVHDVSCTLRLYKKECIDKIPLNWEGQHRFIPLSLALQGYKVAEIISNHRLRKFGVSKYSHQRIFKVIVDFFRILAVRGRK